ncbi:MAG: SpoIID/LytB domain-containing protein [Ignavibacteriaceae bacterium]|nr:SpoIID/LytB domain-containing protein [Ignavibacteriaceae bacterium]
MNKLFYSTITLFTISIFLLFLGGCASSKKFSSDNGTVWGKSTSTIRVNLFNSNLEYSLTAVGSMLLVVDNKKEAIINKNNVLNFSAEGEKVALTIKGKNYIGSEIRLLEANDGQNLFIDGKQLTGYVKVLSSGGKIYFVNVLPFEEYLKGVVPAEMPVGQGTENFEALKAMAICARTYAVIKMNNHAAIFDLYDSVSDQVYGGVNRGNEVSDRAVIETAGMILTYNGNPATTLYYSTCGGRTEDGKNVFESADYPYLVSHDDSSPAYCSVSPRFEWEENYSGDELIKRLTAANLLDAGVNTLKDLLVVSRFESGRVNQLDFRIEGADDSERVVSIYGNRIRGIIRNSDNSAMLNSNWFDVVKTDEGNFILKGKGYGHGVGVCQYGAMTQSKLGKKYRQILNFYYPGTSLKKYDSN